MEKKFKFKDNSKVAKSIYGAIIAILCITAIVIGIVAANNRRKDDGKTDNPPISDGGDENGGGNNNGGGPVTYLAPTSGTVIKKHSNDIPVYSETLEEWRIHTGIDISTAEDAPVFAVAAGEVTKVYSHPLLGKTVEITHSDGLKSVYSNLSPEGLPAVGKSVLSGEKIGKVGDSAICEIADEAHLHFEIIKDEKSVDPLGIISEESKKTSLGIDDGVSA